VSQENLRVVEQISAAWLRSDASVFDGMDRDIELHPDPEAFWVGVDRIYRGHEGVREYMRTLYETFDDYRPEIEGLIDVDDKVVTLAVESGRGKKSGVQVESTRTAHVWTLRDGRAIRLDLYLDRSTALAELGLDSKSAS
jgi:ketosteroid isomerase-like protein